jgi:hypothetical protein
MSDKLILRVCYDLGRLTSNQRLHLQERRRREKTAQAAAQLAYFAAGAPQVEGRARVTLLVRRGRTIDPDHLLAAAEPIINALFCRRRQGFGITPDDSARYVEWAPVQQETGDRWKQREEVVIVVTAAGEDP